VNAQNNEGWTALHFAAQDYQAEMARWLLEHGAAVDPQDQHGNTPLWRAVFNSQGRGNMISVLLGKGADADRRNRHGVSPRELASTIANYDVERFVRRA
jgi:ankyrin repeat protein